MSGGTCPRCGNYCRFSKAGKIGRHRNNEPIPFSRRYRECRAVGLNRDDVARAMTPGQVRLRDIKRDWREADEAEARR